MLVVKMFLSKQQQKKRIVNKIGGFLRQNWLLASHEQHDRTNMFTVK